MMVMLLRDNAVVVVMDHAVWVEHVACDECVLAGAMVTGIIIYSWMQLGHCLAGGVELLIMMKGRLQC